MVAAGSESVFVLRDDGTLWAAGARTDGVLGDGSVTGTSAGGRVQVIEPYGNKWSTVAVSIWDGSSSACAKATAWGAWYCWGLSTSGQTGLGSLTSPISRPSLVEGWQPDWESFSLGMLHTCAKKISKVTPAPVIPPATPTLAFSSMSNGTLVFTASTSNTYGVLLLYYTVTCVNTISGAVTAGADGWAVVEAEALICRACIMRCVYNALPEIERACSRESPPPLHAAVSSATSPVTVSGLVNLEAQRCTATATSDYGTSASSTAILAAPQHNACLTGSCCWVGLL